MKLKIWNDETLEIMKALAQSTYDSIKHYTNTIKRLKKELAEYQELINEYEKKGKEYKGLPKFSPSQSNPQPYSNWEVK